MNENAMLSNLFAGKSGIILTKMHFNLDE